MYRKISSIVIAITIVLIALPAMAQPDLFADMPVPDVSASKAPPAEPKKASDDVEDAGAPAEPAEPCVTFTPPPKRLDCPFGEVDDVERPGRKRCLTFEEAMEVREDAIEHRIEQGYRLAFNVGLTLIGVIMFLLLAWFVIYVKKRVKRSERKVRKYRREVADLREEMDFLHGRLSGFQICPTCQARTRPDALFCGECGARLKEENEPKSDE